MGREAGISVEADEAEAATAPGTFASRSRSIPIPDEVVLEAWLGLVARMPRVALAALPKLIKGKAAFDAFVIARAPADTITIEVETELSTPKRRLRPYVEALRPHQWLKNLLVFLPAAAAHEIHTRLPDVLLAFVAFSLTASSAYVLNDLLDLPGDRAHNRKRRRPFAARLVPVSHGLGMACGLMIAAALLSLLLPWPFAAALAVYYALTCAYSLSLKRMVVFDVIALSCLYGVRLIAGGYASGVELSPWLEGLAAFLFLSLALVKRAAEIIGRINGEKGEIVGRAYRLSDLPAIEAMSAAAGYNAALVLALYINLAPERLLYAHPDRLWLLCILLLAWISRIVLLTRRGEMNEDPVIFAVSDKGSLALGGLGLLVVLAATY